MKLTSILNAPTERERDARKKEEESKRIKEYLKEDLARKITNIKRFPGTLEEYNLYTGEEHTFIYRNGGAEAFIFLDETTILGGLLEHFDIRALIHFNYYSQEGRNTGYGLPVILK